MDTKKIFELKELLQDIESKITKAQRIVSEIKSPFAKLENAIQEIIGNVPGAGVISSKVEINKRTTWADEIITALKKEKMTTMGTYTYFANQGKVPQKGSDGWQKAYNNVRSSMYNMQNIKIKQVSKERGSAWEVI